tara:strand:- start:1069 stop:1284 length:216 start_codon:yes stop_codon:yes gene_type:complete
MNQEENNNQENDQSGNNTKPLLVAVFYPFEYASDNWGETMNYMSEDEIEEISTYDNKSDLDDYLRMFYERT